MALEADIAALKAGKPAEMVSMDPEIQKLSDALWPRSAEFRHPHRQIGAAPLRLRFVAITAKFRDVLQLHARMLTRVKNASEGMIQAIAREVERMNAADAHLWPAARLCAQILRRDGLQQSRLSLRPAQRAIRTATGDPSRCWSSAPVAPHRSAIDDGHDVVHGIAAAGAQQRQAP